MAQDYKDTAQPANDGDILELSRTYTFEGTEYKELNLAGLQSIGYTQIRDMERYLQRQGRTAPMPEMTIEGAIFLAAQGLSLPIEFLQGLNAKDLVKLKNRVTTFLYGEDSET